MKLIALSILFLIHSSLSSLGGKTIPNFSKSEFYTALSSGKINDLDKQLKLLQSTSIIEKDAYEGVLLMRKAGIIKLPSEKLKLFKTGRIKLESSLLQDTSNTEYHFLRLMIQEHAPKIVKYHNDLENDKSAIQKSFKRLNPVVQNAIINYTKSSKILHQEDFKN